MSEQQRSFWKERISISTEEYEVTIEKMLE